MSKTLEEQYSDSVKINYQKLEIDIDKLFNRVGLAMVKNTRKLQDKKKNYATRRLSNLTNYKLHKKNNETYVTFGSNASKNGYNYGLVQEFGRKPGKGVSKEGQKDLLKWLKRKIRLGHFEGIKVVRKTKRMTRTAAERREAILKGIVYLMSQRMKKEGLKGKYLYRKGFLSGNKIFETEINRVLKRALS